MRVLSGFEEPVSSCVWAADGQTFITGSFDKELSICQWDLQGECVHTWTKTHRTEDLALSRDQRWLVAMDERQHLHVYDFVTREHVYDFALSARATSLSFSRDSTHILVNKADNEAILIDIEARETVQRYTGHSGGKYTIRSNFGGANENFVISGSEGKCLGIPTERTIADPSFLQTAGSSSGTSSRELSSRRRKPTTSAATRSPGTQPTRACLPRAATTGGSGCGCLLVPSLIISSRADNRFLQLVKQGAEAGVSLGG